jgi:NAD(P)H-dependent FMN reductase
MKRVLIITHSSEGGLNFLQMMEILNLLGGKGLAIQTYKDPMSVQNQDLIDSDAIIMIVPEWNASFPYSFKHLIDTSGHPSKFKGKPILLIGTSETGFGNVMGITHLQHILEWIGANVWNKRICIPFLSTKFSNNNIVIDERLNKNVTKFVNNFNKI